MANGSRSGGERLQGGALVSSAPTKLSVHQQSNIDTPLVLLVQFLLARLVQLLLAWLVHLRQVHPLKKTLRNRNNIAAGHAVMSSGYTLLYIGGFKGRVCHNSINAG